MPTTPVLDMSLNNGQYCSDKVTEVLQRYSSASRTALRLYSTPSNSPLKNAIAKHHGVSAENVLLGNGSGPLLQQAMILILESKAREAHVRGVKNTFGFLFTEFTYSKMPVNATKKKLPFRMVPMDVENNFKLRLDVLEEMLVQADSLVYLTTPNNPTGQILITASELEPLLIKFPNSVFLVDEAYLHFVDPSVDSSKAGLVKKYKNLLVSCSFSFAYGLAGARLGYIVASPEFVATSESKVTAYTIGKLQEDIAIATLEDDQHLPFVRRVTSSERKKLIETLQSTCGELIDVFDPPCHTNYVLCRFKNATISAEGLRVKLEKEYGILIKSFEEVPSLKPQHQYFRITLCLPQENDQFLSIFPDCLRAYVNNQKISSRL